MAERGQFLTISPGNSRSIAQEIGKKWTVPQFLQPISFKSDRLLGCVLERRTKPWARYSFGKTNSMRTA
jgi:hypothetical protein